MNKKHHLMYVWAVEVLKQIKEGKICKSCGRPMIRVLPCSINKEHQEDHERQ